MTHDIVETHSLEDLHELAALFAAVWGRKGEPPIQADILRALSHSGNYLAGAYTGGAMIGGLVGWLGGRPPEELHLHSHILGVLPGRDAQGLGFALKQHQRAWCLQRSVRVIEWTTDPLVRRNAYFNLTKLGARAPRYLVNFYGVMADRLNSGEESDRLLIRWELDSADVEAAARGNVQTPDVARLIAAGAAVTLRLGDRGQPVGFRGGDARVRLCEVPEDIVALRLTHPELARSWRLALRKALTSALEDGLEIVAATRSGWYVLQEPRRRSTAPL